MLFSQTTIIIIIIIISWLRSTVGGTPVFGRRRTDPVLRARPAAAG